MWYGCVRAASLASLSLSFFISSIDPFFDVVMLVDELAELQMIPVALVSGDVRGERGGQGSFEQIRDRINEAGLLQSSSPISSIGEHD